MRHSLMATERHFVLAWDTYGVRTERHQASRLMSHDAIAATVVERVTFYDLIK